MITLSSPSIVPRILENLTIIAKSVTTLGEINQLDRALAALETRFDIDAAAVRVVHQAFGDAQKRVCPPPPPVIDDTTKFVVLHRNAGSGMWNLYAGARSWADAVASQRHAMGEHGKQGHQYEIALFCPLPATKS